MAKKKTSRAAAGPATDANVDQIREIIFGANIREYEARFSALQEEFASSFKKLKQDLNAGLRRLEGAVAKNREALDGESAARQDGDESIDGLVQNKAAELGQEIDAAEARLSDKLSKLAKDTEAAQREMRRAIEGGNKDLDVKLTKAAAELSDSKVARDELAGLLEDLARRLSGTPSDG